MLKKISFLFIIFVCVAAAQGMDEAYEYNFNLTTSIIQNLGNLTPDKDELTRMEAEWRLSDILDTPGLSQYNKDWILNALLEKALPSNWTELGQLVQKALRIGGHIDPNFFYKLHNIKADLRLKKMKASVDLLGDQNNKIKQAFTSEIENNIRVIYWKIDLIIDLMKNALSGK